MSIICVDFDDTLMDTHNVEQGRRMGKPMSGAVTSMTKLAAQGHILIIFTVRGGEARSRQAVEDWLDFFHVPYSTVTNIKVKADAYIDNKGIHFDNWARTLIDLHKMGV